METIAAISTAMGTGGIGVIRISGDRAIEIADKVFKSIDGRTRLSSLKGYTAKYGKVKDNVDVFDEAVALIFRSPHSYTGEDIVELSCHGGMYVTKRLLSAVIDAGAKHAGPGEFTKRAFLNGKLQLTQAEAVMALISSRNEQANRLALRAREGIIDKESEKIKDQLVDIASALSVWIDYPDEDIPQIREDVLNSNLKKIHYEVCKLINRSEKSRMFSEGIKVVIAGKPNVGKSTIMNMLSGKDRSIVTDIPGTTRDIVEENISIGDIPIILVDTAGIRDTENLVEMIGVKRAMENINTADIVFFIFDGSRELSNEECEILNKLEKSRVVAIINKSDMQMKIHIEKIKEMSNKTIVICAGKGEGIDKLEEAVYEVAGLNNYCFGEVCFLGERQISALKGAEECIKQAQKALAEGVTLDAVAVLIGDSIQKLMELTGESVSEAVIERVFSKFCVGK